MKYYKLQPAVKFKDGVTTTPISITREMIDNYNFNLNLKDQKEWDDSTRIKFVVHDEYGLKVRFSDMHHWHSNKPVSISVIIISENFKKVLEKFILSESTFYPSKISYKNKDLDYWLFQILNNSIEELNFTKSQFEFYDVVQRKISKKFAIGEIKNIDHRNREIEGNNGMSILRLNKAFYNVNYDVFSVEYGGVIINEKVKEAIGESNLDGYEIKEFTEYEIVMLD